MTISADQEVEAILTELRTLQDQAGEKWEDRLRVVKAFIAALGAWARIKANETTREQINFMIARELTNSAEFSKYLKLALPEHGVVKALKEADTGAAR